MRSKVLLFFLLFGQTLMCEELVNKHDVQGKNNSGHVQFQQNTVDPHLHPERLLPLLRHDDKAVCSWLYDKVWYKYRYISLSSVATLSACIVWLYMRYFR